MLLCSSEDWNMHLHSYRQKIFLCKGSMKCSFMVVVLRLFCKSKAPCVVQCHPLKFNRFLPLTTKCEICWYDKLWVRMVVHMKHMNRTLQLPIPVHKVEPILHNLIFVCIFVFTILTVSCIFTWTLNSSEDGSDHFLHNPAMANNAGGIFHLHLQPPPSTRRHKLLIKNYWIIWDWCWLMVDGWLVIIDNCYLYVYIYIINCIDWKIWCCQTEFILWRKDNWRKEGMWFGFPIGIIGGRRHGYILIKSFLWLIVLTHVLHSVGYEDVVLANPEKALKLDFLAYFTGTCLCTRGVCFSSPTNGCSIFDYCWLLGMVVNFWTFIKWLGVFLVMALIFSLHFSRVYIPSYMFFLTPT